MKNSKHSFVVLKKKKSKQINRTWTIAFKHRHEYKSWRSWIFGCKEAIQGHGKNLNV